MILDLVTIGAKLIDKIIPDVAEQNAAKVKLLSMEQNGALKEMEASLSAIKVEAKSKDKWTSRARPSFLYVMYIMILACIPMGVLFAVSPDVADNIVLGMNGWLGGIPDPMWMLFGTGYLGYTGARSMDKRKNV